MTDINRKQRRAAKQKLPPFVKEGRLATVAEVLEWWPELRAKLASMGYEDNEAKQYLAQLIARLKTN